MNIEEKIINELNKIRPFLQNDGGDVEFVDFSDGTVYVRLQGACVGCPIIDITLHDGIEEILVNEINEVKKVVNIE